MEIWDNIIKHRKRREMRLDEKRIMDSSYPAKADYMIRNGIASEKMICCLDNQVLDMLLRNYFRKDGIRTDADEEEKGGSKGKHGNTHIPYGLCEREGIEIGKDWTPRDAWNALEGKGYSASQEYENLKNGLGAGHSKEGTKKTPTIDSARQAAKKFRDEYRKVNEEKQDAIKEYLDKKYAKRNFRFELSAYESDTKWVKDNNIDEEYMKKLDDEYKELLEKQKSFKDKHRWQWTDEEKGIDDRIHVIIFDKQRWETANDSEIPLKGEKIERELKAAKEKCSSIDKKRKKVLEEFSKSYDGIDVKEVKFYDDAQRTRIREKAIKKLNVESFSEESKETIKTAITNASDIHLAILEKTLEGSSIEADESCSCSHYTFGTGHITMEADRNDAREVFHEYGHYMDDAEVSGILFENTEEDETYEYGTKTFSNAIESVRIESAAAQDFNDLAKKMGANFEFGYDEENKFMTIKKDGTDLEMNFDFVGNIIRSVSQKPINDVNKKYEVPKSPKFDDYFEYYRTPKRQTLKERPKTKTSEEEWHKALREYNDKMAEIRENTEYEADMAKAYEESNKIEHSLQGLSDILCALTTGRCLSAMGSHEQSYYQYGSHKYNEITANLHQMMFMNDEVEINAFKDLMPRTSDTLFKLYNDWMWRNI